ncbi:hypothetical protein ACFUMH_10090 [Cellulomonas sp. NPDC057328]|uniref:hypothetical protein n=1 Tax=Cellulomonas sp. NPDC057328 TaxID=3346101 RepID=UPI0036341735
MTVPTPGPQHPDEPGAVPSPAHDATHDAPDAATHVAPDVASDVAPVDAPVRAAVPWWSVAAFVLAAVTVVAVIGTLVPAVRAPNVLGPVAIVLAVVGRRRGEGRVATAALWTSVGAVVLQLLLPVLGWIALVLWSVSAG